MSTTIITGLSGWGKSYHACRIIRARTRVLVCSPYPEDDFGRCCMLVDWQHAHKVITEDESFRRAFSLKLHGEMAYNAMDKICRILFSDGHDFLFVIDEAQRYRISAHGEFPPGLHSLCDEGRHKKIDVCMIARRPVQIAPIGRSLASDVITFRLRAGNDIKILEDWFGDYSEEARELNQFHRMEYHAKNSDLIWFDQNNKETRRVSS